MGFGIGVKRATRCHVLRCVCNAFNHLVRLVDVGSNSKIVVNAKSLIGGRVGYNAFGFLGQCHTVVFEWNFEVIFGWYGSFVSN